MHADRFFDSDPTVRRIARSLYEETSRLPIISPHGHVDPRLLADDAPFPEPTSLFILPDHYVLRMLYSRGIPMESLGIAPKGGGPYERDLRKIWQTFGENYYLFRGTPSSVWLDYQFREVFGVTKALDVETASEIYDEIRERLASP